jgi:hypothetical protein
MFKTYRWSWKSIFGYFPFVLYFGFFCLVFSLLLGLIIIPHQNDSQTQPLSGLPLFLFGFLSCMFGSASLFFLVMPVIQVIFGYIKISPAELEYQRWPFGKIRAGWDKIESVREGTLNLERQGPLLLMPKKLNYATLLIRRSKPGWEIPIAGSSLGSAKYHIVPLSEFEGWSDGSLATDLRKHAPHAFPPN